MDTIKVAHCRLHIVRKGGWSWGVSPRVIANQAAQILPELILQRLASKLSFESNAFVESPVRLRIALNRQELLSLLSVGNRFSGLSSSTIDANIDAAIEISGLQRSVEQIVEQDRRASTTSQTANGNNAASVSDSLDATPLSNSALNRSSDASRSRRQTNNTSGLLVLLERHFQLGSLALFLNQLSIETLIEWDLALSRINESGPSQEQTFDSDPKKNVARAPASGSKSTRENGKPSSDNFNANIQTQLGQIVLDIARSMPTGTALKARIAYRIHATLVAYLKLRIMPGNIELRSLLEEHLPIHQFTSTPFVATSTSRWVSDVHLPDSYDGLRTDEKKRGRDRAAFQTRSSHEPRSQTFDVAQSMVMGEWQIASVLPFLLLGPLDRSGYLETLAVALEAAGLEHYSQAFAFALASKVLGEPVRGQLKDAEMTASATAFAGNVQWPGEGVKTLGSQADQFVSALNAQLAHALLIEHDVDNPLLLSRLPNSYESKLLLADPRGMFPLAIMHHVSQLGSVLCRSDSPLLLVTSELVTTEFLNSLIEFGYRFVMECPPTRGESFRKVRDRSGQRYWTNDTTTSANKLARIGSALTVSDQTMVAFCKDVGSKHTGLDAGRSLLDETLTLAAGVALAQIAWELWRNRESTHPLLTLERFRDLSGLVSFSEEHVQVKLPLGRRAADLAAHGMLEDVNFVPWLNGRRIVFGQG